MTTPIDPGDTAALHDVWWAGYRSFIENCEAVFTTDQAEEAGMQAVARSVCPPDCVVVRRDDLETALYGSQYWGEELRQDGEQEALDRLRALIGDE